MKRSFRPFSNNGGGERFASPLDDFPDFREGIYYDIAFPVHSLPGLSFSAFQVVEGEGDTFSSNDERTIENDSVQLNLENDGTITLFDKKNGKCYEGLNQFYSSLDAGDEYNYSPPEKDVVTFAKLAGEPTVYKSQRIEKMAYQVSLELPKGLNHDRTGPSQKKVETLIDVSVILFDGNEVAEVAVNINNCAKDQRLRVKFPIGSSITHTYSDAPFDFVKRSAKKQEVFDAEKLSEVPVVVEPSYSMIQANNRFKGLTILQRGVQEYQVKNGKTGDELEVTLLRSVGWLSRDDLRTRGGGAGPRLETPEAQCLGEYPFTYAFGPFRENLAGESLTQTHMFRVPPRIYGGSLPAGRGKSLLSLDNRNVQWSAIRQIGEKVMIRLWNPGDQQEKVVFSSSYSTFKAEKVNFNFERILDCQKESGMLTDVIEPKKIVTYLLEFDKERMRCE
jgi:alpha-mannosidase